MISRALLFTLLILCLTCHMASAAPTPLNEKELEGVTGQSAPIQISMEADTVRLFFDTYMEIYSEIDRVRAGYYYKTRKDLTTRKSLNYGELTNHGAGAPTHGDPRISWGDTIDHNADGNADARLFRVMLGADSAGDIVWTDPEIAQRYEVYEGDAGSLAHASVDIPWVDDDYLMYKYITMVGQHIWIDGAQGDNSFYFPIFGDQDFSQANYRNRNYLDWDLAMENLRMGSNPENPVLINGLVIRLKYDDISAPDRKLTDIIVGTNDLQGDLFFDYRRATGFYNPKLPHQARNPILQVGGTGNSEGIDLIPDLAAEFNITPGPVIYQRDTMMTIVDHMHLARNFKQQDQQGWFDAVPDNPLDNTQHTGFFLRVGLDRDSPHFGYQLVAGYNERVASCFQYRGEHLNESMYRWWNSMDHAESTNTYPGKLAEVWHNDPPHPQGF